MTFEQAQRNWEASWINGPKEDPLDYVDELGLEELTEEVSRVMGEIPKRNLKYMIETLQYYVDESLEDAYDEDGEVIDECLDNIIYKAQQVIDRAGKYL